MVHLAQKIAAGGSHRHFRHAVVIVMDGQIISVGANTSIIHAEAVAVEEALKKVKSLYRALVWSFRVTATGKLAMAKPCTKCANYLKNLGISVVYYSDSLGGIQKIRLSHNG